MEEAYLANNSLGYLETYSNKNTLASYRNVLGKFFKIIYGDKDISQADKYVSEDRDYEADLQTFFIAIMEKTPKTIKHNLAVVKTFFIENGINIEERKWRSLIRRIQGKGAVTKVHVPTPDEFRRILTHMDSRKAFFCVWPLLG
jgi:integrase